MSGGLTGEPEGGSASAAPRSSAGAEEAGSMDAVIASIRQIIRGDEPQLATGAGEVATARGGDGVLRLDPSMLVSEPAAAPAPVTPPLSSSRPEPAAHSEQTLAPEPAPAPAPFLPAGATSVGALLQLAGRTAAATGGGLTVETLVRESLRPLLTSWLDTHLPPIVERIVRIEVERLLNRG